MIVECPHCGKSVTVNGIGRRPLQHSVKNICDALLSTRSVKLAANELNCSRGYIYQVLKRQSTTPKEVLAKGQAHQMFVNAKVINGKTIFT